MNKHGILINSKDILEEKYKVIKHIASGGMSEVFLVEDMNNANQQWAVKVVNKESKLSQKLIDETKILSELDHPNIPKMIDFFSSDDYIYLVMEYADGIVLSDFLLQNEFEISVEKIIRMGIQLCDILIYLHNQEVPIIYRDLKPGNIIMGEDGNIKLIDFGISRRFHEDKMRDTVKIGTVGFAAPEQFEQKQSDQRTDLFSLGSLLYYLLSKGNYVYIAQKPISHFAKRLPRKLEKCINQLVELQPEKRIQNAQDTKKLLEEALNETNKENKTYLKITGLTLLSMGVIISIIFQLV